MTYMRRRQAYARQVDQQAKAHMQEIADAIGGGLEMAPFRPEPQPMRGKPCPKCGKSVGRGMYMHMKACHGDPR